MKRSTVSYQRLRSCGWRAILVLVSVVSLVTSTLVGGSVTPAFAATLLPCDIYAAAGTPCVAAHSTVRALFSAYNGNLYQVKRWSDLATTDIGTLSAGGYANAAAQDTFCSGTSCTITKIYDQTAKHNDLLISAGGYWKGPGRNGSDLGANAAALPITVGGHRVYGLYVSSGVGYRDNATSGVATNGAPEGTYMVTSGTHVNNRCCFDYGNAETSGTDTGNGHMDAVYFGSACWFTPCSGSGPWVQADMENGLFAGGNGSDTNNTGNSSQFVTALLKNNGQNTYAIKGGNAQSGGLTTWYNGAEPNRGGYAPMHQEGAIVLGTGGDNSNWSVGSFFEGVMTAGYPTDAADNAVQANITSVGYSTITSSFPVTGTKYRLTNLNSGKVLDAVNCGTAPGTLVDQWQSLGNTCQQWVFNSLGNGVYTLTNANSGLALDVYKCGGANGNEIDTWTLLNNMCQKWNVLPTGDGHYVLVASILGRTLDDKNCGRTNGTPVQTWQWLDNTCQEWSIAP
jgi:hypothetical protein